MSKPAAPGALAVFADRRMFSVLLLGFSSGLPLLLVGSTLSAWLKESGVDIKTIGLFALVGVPYSFKFAWAPVLDRVRLPWLGRRRSWLLATQAALLASLVGLALQDPTRSPARIAIAALLVAFFSASQDVVIDAWRVEALRLDQQGAGAGVLVLGYRLGMLTAGAGALYLATYAGWRTTFLVMAGLVVPGMITALLAHEPVPPDLALTRPGPGAWLRAAVYDPLADFLRRPAAAAILLFILLYKFGDALAGTLATPFYLELGFTKPEIASVSKLFGLIAILAGGLLGGALVGRLGLSRSLLLCGVLQMLSNLMFAALAQAGHDVRFLIATIAIENLTSGMGQAAFVAYLSSLCSVAYTGTQYALLSSLMSVGRTTLSSAAGYLVAALGWVAFFVLTTVAALPGLLLLLWLMRRFPPDEAARPSPA